MKEKILQQLRASVAGSDGKTSLSDQTLNAYADFLAKQISEESQIADAIKPHAELLNLVQGNINHTAAASATEKETVLKTAFEKQIADLKKQIPRQKPDDDLDSKINAIFEKQYDAKIAELNRKIEERDAKETGEKRRASIIAKAKELNIPQFRIDEGFAIAPDADESAIGEYLAKAAKNVVAMSVESDKTGFFPIATPLDQAKKEAEAWADSLPEAKK
ncbi:MAG: hypothetical protein LBJ01_06615 [Tannerella sp.]|jgi:hypothetical protein|nr:hypothetical protein [Tannerella sp.]